MDRESSSETSIKIMFPSHVVLGECGEDDFENDSSVELISSDENELDAFAIDGLKLAYNRSLHHKESLLEKISEQEVKINELNSKLVQAATANSALNQTIEALCAKITDQDDHITQLQETCRELEVYSITLNQSLSDKSISESKLFKSMSELTEESSRVKEELNKQRNYCHQIINMKNVEIQNVIKANREEVQRAYWEGEKKANQKLVDAEEMRTKVSTLEKELCDKMTKHNGNWLELQNWNEELKRENSEFKKKLSDLHEAYEQLLMMWTSHKESISNTTLHKESISNTFDFSWDSLYENTLESQMQISNPEVLDIDNMEVINDIEHDESRFQVDIINELKAKDKVNLSYDFTQYLYITAKVVMLHFPHMIDAETSEQLIVFARNWPWYLYHDRMMWYMRKEDRKRKKQKQSKLDHNSIHVESKSFAKVRGLLRKLTKTSRRADLNGAKRVTTLKRVGEAYVFDNICQGSKDDEKSS